MASRPSRSETGFDPRHGEPVAIVERVVRITAPNPGPYTFTGTNSYVLGRHKVFVVDPGPQIDSHIEALVAVVGGRDVEAVLLTHTHRDHCAGAPELARRLDAPIWFDGRARPGRAALVPDRILVDGETLRAGDTELMVIATPGHCADHLAFGLVNSEIALSGDHVMGWSSTLIARPDGSMADYLASLDKLLASPFGLYLPGHGAAIADGRARAMALKAHRLSRNNEVLDAIEAGADGLEDIVGRIYPDLSDSLRPAARMTVAAHLDYLEQMGQLRLTAGKTA